MINVLIYVYVNENAKGGIERLVSELANHGTDYGVNIVVLADCEPGVPFPYKLNDNITYITRKSTLTNGYKSFIQYVVKKHSIDKVVVMRSGSWMHLLFSNALANTSIPVVLSEHATPKIATKEFPQTTRQASLYAVDHIHLLLNSYEKSIPEEIKCKVQVIPNFVELSGSPKRNTSNKSKSIVMVGRLTAKQKRPMLLLQAFQKLALDFPDWNLVFYGAGPEEKIMLEYIQHHKLEERVKLAGQISNIPQYLLSADIFCLPSAYEGLPISLLEAMAAGLPSVVFGSADGSNEVIKHEVTGLLAEDNGLHNSLRILMEDEELRNKLGDNAQTESLKYSKSKILPQWFNFLKTIDKYQRSSVTDEETLDKQMLAYLLNNNLICR